MNIVLPKSDLLRLVARCQGLADKKSAMPALANILLDASDGSLRVSATDLYLGHSSQAAAAVTTPGSIAVPARDMLDRVKMMPEGPAQLSVSAESQLLIKSVGAARRYTLHGMPGAEYPLLAKPTDDAKSFAVPVSLLSWLLAVTEFSVSTDETRPHVNSMLIEWDKKLMRAVSTDGHRLSKAEAAFALPRAGSMLVPLKAVRELRRLLDGAGDDGPDVGIAQSGPTVFFTVGDVVFSVKTIDAAFPPYAEVIPSTNAGACARVPRGQFLDAVRAMRITANGTTNGVKCTFGESKVALASETSDGCSGADEIVADYDGQVVSVGSNARYLVETLTAIEGDEALVFVTGQLDPIVVRPAVESKERSYLGVIMPMRI